MAWVVLLLPPAARQLDKTISRRISKAISELGHNPRPSGAKRLVGVDAWRIRIGDWRVIYQIENERLIVLVIRIGHRREVYD